MIDLQLFISIFCLIFVAELPDKTAIATLILASRNKPSAVFVGVALAFMVQSLVGVAFGSVIGLLPAEYVRYGSGILFIIFAILMLRPEGEEEDEAAGDGPAEISFWRIVFSAFMVIFIAEWGDLTQLATATLQAKYHAPVTVFLASTLALWSVAGVSVAVGHYMKRFIHPPVIKKVAAVAFFAVGIYILVR